MTVPALPTSMGPGRPAAPGSTCQPAGRRRRSARPCARSPAAISEVSRLRSGRPAMPGAAASAASTRARLVMRLRARARRTVARTGAPARSAPATGRAHGRERSAAGRSRTGRAAVRRAAVARAPRAASLASRRAVRAAAPGARRRVLRGVLRAPGEARLALGVDGGEHQAAEQAEVLEEVDALLGPPRRRPSPPRTGGRPGWSAPGCRRAGPTRAAGTGPVASSSPAPTWTAPLILTSCSVSSGR